jgi:hypothetical protein
MNAAPAISSRLSAALNGLKTVGVEPSRDEMAWLAVLCEKADRPIEYGIPPVAGGSHDYGGETFWPLHRLAVHWYSRWYGLLEGDDDDQALSLAFASSRSAVGDTSLLRLNTIKTVREALTEWGDNLAIPSPQITPLLNRIQEISGIPVQVANPTPPKTQETKTYIYADVVNLCQYFPGTTPEYWRSGISFADSAQILDAVQHNEGTNDIANEKHPAIASVQNAVKWILHWHGKGEEGEPIDGD